MGDKLNVVMRSLQWGAATAALTVGALVTVASPANAATFTGTGIGACAQAKDAAAYRKKLLVRVNEVNIKVTGFFGEEVGRIKVPTAYMTMNVEWCSDGNTVKYATVQSNAAAPTGNGAGLERKGYTKSGRPPTAIGGPYTLTTSATWGRKSTATISASPFGIGGTANLIPADFQSTMTVNIYPNGAIVDCTGSTAGSVEECVSNE